MTDLQIEELENYFKPIYYVEYEIIPDVIICALIAAKRDGIDIERAVSLKMQINAQRAAMQGDKL